MLYKELGMIIRCRCILENERGNIFVVRQRPEYKFLSLPGGKLEQDESTLECIKRELFEELGVRIEPVLKVIHELTSINSLEFIFFAKVSEDMLHLQDATHAFEIHEPQFVDTLTSEMLIYPEFVCDKDFLESIRREDTVRYILN